MIERIYSNVAIFHESDRIITTYKFEDSQPSPIVKSHVAKRLIYRKQWKKNATVASMDCQERAKSPSSGLGGLPSPPVESSKMQDDSAVSPIALDTPSSGSEEVQNEQVDEDTEMTDAEIMEKIAQLKAEKHRLFQQVKDMISKDTAGTAEASPQPMVEEKPSLVMPTMPQYSTTSRPSSPPASPNPRMSPYPSPSSPVNGNGSYNKNAFKINDRPFSRTPYDRPRPYSLNTPPLSPPTASGRRSPAIYGQPYRHPYGPRQGYFGRMPPNRRY
ncbi:hypothetical protein INT43_007153 [Umbelopsis isabellina]|uniref:Uncharacterized protein n=1 Tax=Mortierella isabellina TaxID=91625 RepID=A0A8H7UE12_MORIS|nr:hypothetical protein INT43_007153 [Umbelopsis isabellina]